MKAKSKPLAQKTPADYGVDVAPRLKTLKVEEPPCAAPASRLPMSMRWSRKLKGWESQHEDARLGRT
jgi:hypothetical protein